MIKMNPLTIPILVTIAIVGIIAIVLVKFFYTDKDSSDLSDELPPIFASHWQESFDIIPEVSDDEDDSDEDLNEYGFVSKSWVEPMEQKEESDNGVSSKVFQEPMDSKHQDIISNEYQEDNYTPIENNIDDDYYDTNDSNNIEFDELQNENTENNTDSNNYPNEINDESTTEPTTEYITPKEYYSQNTADYDKHEDYDDETGINENNSKYDSEIDNDYSDSYDNTKNNDSPDYSINNDLSENRKETLDDFGDIGIGEQVIVGGQAYIIHVGDEIIFNYNGESYSSKIFEIAHENLKVKYRSKEKWIKFSDIKKVF